MTLLTFLPRSQQPTSQANFNQAVTKLPFHSSPRQRPPVSVTTKPQLSDRSGLIKYRLLSIFGTSVLCILPFNYLIFD
ncbi:hypothetical protein CONLIGDRAFT_635843 [Coniochaeta ligniaria NRRL 30616]|uniref:Uncharacterized protein n=1 Tax=Coniochaeta ligniaria NRRL 30616 TaxID=1408157 RepID=A0A1J7IFB0_9PEZI|nr:hypothetical protein CONLIGDRAFT_635843 [Coniochaeta ligniaria NRRL 30616]